MFKHIDYTMIVVSDMQRSIEFYRDKLGIPLKFQSPEWTDFATGATTLALHGGGVPSLGHRVPPLQLLLAIFGWHDKESNAERQLDQQSRKPHSQKPPATSVDWGNYCAGFTRTKKGGEGDASDGDGFVFRLSGEA